MNEIIEILGVKINNDSVEEAVDKVAGFLETEALSTVGMIFVNGLIDAAKEPGWAEKMDQMDLNLIGDREVWEVCGEGQRQSAKDAQSCRFLKEVLEYAISRQKSVAFLTEKDSEKTPLQKYMKKNFRGLHIVGIFSLEDATEDEDSIVNLLNASAEDIILSALPSPYQEEFLIGCRQKLGAKVWIGLGQSVTSLRGPESKVKFLGKLIEKRIFKRKVLKSQNEKGD